MRVLRDSSPLPPACFGAVLALGNFDGMHVGHAEIISKAVSLAKSAGKPAMVMTFEPHPRRIFRPDLPNLKIMSLSDKLRRMAESGADFLRVARFTRAFSEITAGDFVRRVLRDTLHVSHVVTGEDFVFGHNREGNTGTLRAWAAECGFAATACPQVLVDGERCSSTRIREALAEGRVGQAAKLLGRPYTISGHVRHGDKRGRVLGFATANILPPRLFLPALGIYAVRARVRGEWVQGVANFGIRPDFPLDSPLLEVHLFDWAQDIYGEPMDVELVRYLRQERKFDSIEALTGQMAADCHEAKAFLAGA